MTSPSRPADGPTLETYVETRFNLMIVLLNEKIHFQDEALKAAVDASKAQVVALDLRYQQQFEAHADALRRNDQRYEERHAASQKALELGLAAQKSEISAALAAAERAVLKAEVATEKRFESVNEFRGTLDQQQRTLIPRSEVDVLIRGVEQKTDQLTKQVDALIAERAGVKGGYGYAVGVVGFVLTLVSLGVLVLRALQP